MKKILLTTLAIMSGLGVFFIGTVHAEHPFASSGVDVTATVLGVCGNDLVEPYEQCDGIDLNAKSCMSLGYATGTISCSNSCAFDVAMCIPFPTTASTSEPIYDSQGRAQESITMQSNSNYPKEDVHEEEVASPIPQNLDQGNNSDQSSGNGGTNAGGSSSQSPSFSSENLNQNTNTSKLSDVSSMPSTPKPEPLSVPQLMIVTTYWIGVNGLILLIANIKKIWALLVLAIAGLLRFK